MTMKKTSSEGIPCTYCSSPALPGTNPPVCGEHLQLRKQATAEPSTLKELSVDEGGNNK